MREGVDPWLVEEVGLWEKPGAREENLGTHPSAYSCVDDVHQEKELEKSSMHAKTNSTPSVPMFASHMILFRVSSSFFSTSMGDRSRSSATALCRAMGRRPNSSHRSPSVTCLMGR